MLSLPASTQFTYIRLRQREGKLILLKKFL